MKRRPCNGAMSTSTTTRLCSTCRARRLRRPEGASRSRGSCSKCSAESRFGPLRPEWFLFPFGSPQPSDPCRPVTDLTHAWDAIREEAGVDCRIHDLRHTFVSRLAEAGVPETTIMEIVGNV